LSISPDARLRLLAQDQHSVALFDADEALEKAFPEQVHLARGAARIVLNGADGREAAVTSVPP